MADDNDNMEITSEANQDDIDIDIDLDPDRQDEDAILEDANSDTGLDEDYDIQLLPSPVQVSDDLMVDDENASYAMDDIPNQTQETENINVGGTSPINDTAIVYNPNYRQQSIPLLENMNGHPEPDWIHELQDGNMEAPDLGIREDEVPAKNEVEALEDVEEVDESKVLSASSPPPGVVASPEDNDGTGFQDGIIEGTQKHPRAASVSEADDSTHIPHFVEETHSEAVEPISTPGRKVVVLYQETEYALVPYSESDDPDSYFLKDDSLTRAPLSDFLSALRDVIGDDLSHDDELCLAVEDLGIEISETSTSVFDLTFATMIELHTRLLKNDGVQTPGPLYISLGSKPDCSKRLATLAAGAAEGKGLSEFLAWDAESDSLQEEDTHHVEDDINGHGEYGGEHNGEQSGEQSGKHDSRGIIKDDSVESPNNGESTVELLSEEADEKQNSVANGPEDTTPDPDPDANDIGVSGVVNSAPHNLDPAEVLHTSEEDEKDSASVITSKHEEEDDLIDYEDEGYEQEQQKLESSLATVEQSNHNAGSEASDADRRRGSLSNVVQRVDERPEPAVGLGSDVVPAVSQEPPTSVDETASHAIAPLEGTFEETELTTIENHAESKELEEQYELHSYEEVNETSIHSYQNSHQQQSQPSVDAGLIEDADQKPSNDAEDHKAFDLTGDEEIDFEIKPDDTEGHQLQNGPSLDSSRFEDNISHAEEIDYEESNEVAEINDSEATMVPEDADDDQHDEIDYEDDDAATLTKGDLTFDIVSGVEPISDGASVKRPRADGDDGTGREGKDTKRIRS